MEQRELKELLILLRDYIVNQKDDIFLGMCRTITKMYAKSFLTYSETEIYRYFLLNNTPKGLDKLGYWFPRGEKQPRIDWLNEEISKL